MLLIAASCAEAGCWCHRCSCRSPVLLAGLGWSSQLPGAVLATQLSALGTSNRHVSDAALAQKLARVVPVLYGALAALPAAELAAAAAVLEGQPTVWVGNGFVPAERVAFKVCHQLRCLFTRPGFWHDACVSFCNAPCDHPHMLC